MTPTKDTFGVQLSNEECARNVRVTSIDRRPLGLTSSSRRAWYHKKSRVPLLATRGNTCSVVWQLRRCRRWWRRRWRRSRGIAETSAAAISVGEPRVAEPSAWLKLNVITSPKHQETVARLMRGRRGSQFSGSPPPRAWSASAVSGAPECYVNFPE